ncbi:aspartyl-phosphate phosphatase Spo0E family protein [Paenibacillus agilis]|uniref:Aspartyl-phosphate phosphatase Spo0E family protein n=1 Tax=Paenibacillus agilis TaxID=3020863 RepID=A0A559IC66_9BACL|nr:aspartyl-phosphate phosphatase Spo0E family protein [Paenibacillus agilis]TVX85268.1 aspartyl-phosphate phosphatase Spo0E family protein [Paenibacillus agilis]
MQCSLLKQLDELRAKLCEVALHCEVLTDPRVLRISEETDQVIIRYYQHQREHKQAVVQT